MLILLREHTESMSSQMTAMWMGGGREDSKFTQCGLGLEANCFELYFVGVEFGFNLYVSRCSLFSKY